ncbi:MAG: glycosyltransferase family 39 protein [Leadbetterella sp.]
MKVATSFGFWIVLAIAACLRLYELDARGIYTDEFFSLLNAHGIFPNGGNQEHVFSQSTFTSQEFWKEQPIRSYFESIAHSDFGTHIVYNTFLHFWIKMFGISDFTVRLLSVIFSLLSVWAVYKIAITYFKSTSAALIAGMCTAIDPFHIAQSHIARSYTLSFFLMLLATWVFLQIMQKKSSWRLFTLYTVLLVLGLLNHYLNFLVPLAHGLVFVVSKTSKKHWIGMLASASACCVAMFCWFSYGGGYTALGFLKDKNMKQLELAKNAHEASGVQLTTPTLLVKKTFELLFDSNLVSLQVVQRLNGMNMVGISVCIFLLLLVSHIALQRSKSLLAYGTFLGAVILVTIFKNNFYAIIAINGFLFVLYFIVLEIKKYKGNIENEAKKHLLIISLLLLILPILFVLYDAYKNGHTTSLAKRYIGISSTFSVFLVGVGIPLLVNNLRFGLFWALMVCLGQYKVVKNETSLYFEDKSVTYNWYEYPREPNPFKKIADLSLKYHQTGDTLLIPGGFQNIYEKKFGDKPKATYFDAQRINLYLPKDSKMPQYIDPSERNVVYLRKKDGTKFKIFDLEETKYRY